MLLLMAASAASCAEGYSSTSPQGFTAGPAPVAMGAPDFMGEACERGQRALCTCPDGSEGMKVCTPDPKSPTLASFTGCLNCPEPPPVTPPPAGMSGTSTVGPDDGAAAAGSGGMNGRGAGGRMGGASGSGGAAGRSTGGRAGSSGGTRGGRCNCTNSCVPIGIAPCCRIDGSCGCTWAPGAYCL